MTEGYRHDFAPIGSGKNWVTDVGGLPLMIRDVAHALIRAGHPESEAIQLAVGAVQRWARGEGGVKPDTRARAAAAISDWERKKALAHASGNRDDSGTVTEQGSAKFLLPVATPKVPKPRPADAPHAFRGRKACSVCDGTPDNALHRLVKSAGNRADISEHPMAVQSVAPTRGARAIDKAEFIGDADAIEPLIHDAMTKVFAQQKTDAIRRLKGRRTGGFRSLYDGYRAAQDDEDATTPPPDPALIFDPAAAAAQVAKVITPIYGRSAELSAKRVERQIGAAPGVGSLDAAKSILKSRAERTGTETAQTTFKQIADTLAEGTSKGENMTQLTDRVAHVFDTASSSRARTIARTESIGSLNESSLAYAKSTGVVTAKGWLAHHDNRTRPTHVAAGLLPPVPIDSSFLVGGSLMQFPGDPSAPPDETVNCRCGLHFVTSTPSKEAA